MARAGVCVHTRQRSGSDAQIGPSHREYSRAMRRARRNRPEGTRDSGSETVYSIRTRRTNGPDTDTLTPADIQRTSTRVQIRAEKRNKSTQRARDAAVPLHAAGPWRQRAHSLRTHAGVGPGQRQAHGKRWGGCARSPAVERAPREGAWWERRQWDRTGRAFNGAQRGAPVPARPRRSASTPCARHRRLFVGANRQLVPGMPIAAGIALCGRSQAREVRVHAAGVRGARNDANMVGVAPCKRQA